MLWCRCTKIALYGPPGRPKSAPVIKRLYAILSGVGWGGGRGKRLSEKIGLEHLVLVVIIVIVRILSITNT